MNFSVVFWNIWQPNQLTQHRFEILSSRLSKIIDDHEPNAIGLNEVLADPDNGRARILTYLESRGYTTHYAPFGPQRAGRISGSALALRQADASVNLHELGPDNTAAHRGFPGHTFKLLVAEVNTGNGQTLRLGVNHFAHIVPYNWSTHIKHHRALSELVSNPEWQQCTVIGGDFNQIKLMPRVNGLLKNYHRATGDFLSPTWRPAGSRLTLLRANYDHVLWSKCGSVELKEFAVLPRYPSDHAPLLARFRIS